MAIWLVNPHGIEVLVGDYARSRMELQGKLHLFKRRATKTIGKGNPNDILVDIRENGIGDDIHSLPALWQKVQNGFNVTVTGREMNRKLFERIGCKFVSEKNTDGEYIKKSINDFGIIYSLKMWCTEHDFDARLTGAFKERFKQFADFIEVELPKSFNWRPFLLG